MALSNPPANVPAVVEDSPVTQLDDQVIRLRIGGVTYGIPLRDIGAQLDKQMIEVMHHKQSNAPAEQALRSGIKALLPMALRLLATEVKSISARLVAAGGLPLPLPELRVRHPDMLDYSARYLAALILSLLAVTPWEAESGETVDGPDGYVRLSGLSGGITPPPQVAEPDANIADADA